MKPLYLCALIASCSAIPAPRSLITAKGPETAAEKIIIITIDGFRTQEFFGGADDDLLHDSTATSDYETMQLLYGGENARERRKKLLPFLWTVAVKEGTIMGNHEFGNHLKVSNPYRLSYPGYNEMFSGSIDLSVYNNRKVKNKNVSIFEALQTEDAYRDRIGVFTSWDHFSDILNKNRSALPVNCGFDCSGSDQLQTIDRLLSEAAKTGVETRDDQITALLAKAFLKVKRPHVLYIGLGESDEFAHQGNYASYLEKANSADAAIASLWTWCQSNPDYRDKTTFIVTTDHGRGKNQSTWKHHGMTIKGSADIWMAIFGARATKKGELKTKQTLYLKQTAATIGDIAGFTFSEQSPLPALN